MTALVGLLLERTVIRFLCNRPLETLLATWGVSLIFQQFIRSVSGQLVIGVGIFCALFFGAIARALMDQPKLLVLDEPTEGIQPSIILEIKAVVQHLIKTTGIAVLLVEQHLYFVRQADCYYAMQKGGIVASGPTHDLSQAVIQQFLAV